MEERPTELLDKDLTQPREGWREELFSFPKNRTGRWLLAAAGLVALVALQTDFAQPIRWGMNAIFIAMMVVGAVPLVAGAVIFVIVFLKKSREQRAIKID